VGEQPTGGAKGRPSTLTVTVAAVAFVAVAVGFVGILSSDDDDRPVIVVRNGSTIFDGGDAQDHFKRWKDWEMDSTDAKEWKPNHPGGAAVKSFSVVVSGFDPASPSNCGNILSGEDVVITVSNGQVTEPLHVFRRLRVSIKPPFAKHDPVIDAPSAMTATPQTPTAPATLTYPNIGSIASVKVDTTTCTFPSESPARDAVRIYIKPER
jgi:hypothetical protein